MKKIGFIILTATFLINIKLQFFNFDNYVLFLERYLSPDKVISYPKLLFFKINFFFIYGYLILWSFNKIRYPTLSSIDKIIIPIVLIISILFIAKKNQSAIINSLFAEDGFFEWLTVVLAFSASLLLTINIRKFQEPLSKIILSLASIALFFFAMEEISWGQRIFEWKTGETLGGLNYQNETNLHNLFNPIFPIFYTVFTFTITIILLSLDKIRIKLANISNEKNYALFTLGNANQLYAFIFLFLGIYGQLELTEAIFSVCCFSYALNLDQFRRKNHLNKMTKANNR